MAQNRILGRRRRRQGNTTPQRMNDSIVALVENYGNGYVIADTRRMMICMSNKLYKVHKEMLKKEAHRDTQGGAPREG
jgi:hypothetical protein